MLCFQLGTGTCCYLTLACNQFIFALCHSYLSTGHPPSFSPGLHKSYLLDWHKRGAVSVDVDRMAA